MSFAITRQLPRIVPPSLLKEKCAISTTKHSSPASVVKRLKAKNLFIPGYCENPHSDSPDLNMRVFDLGLGL